MRQAEAFTAVLKILSDGPSLSIEQSQEIIREILEDCGDGTYAGGHRLIAFLHAEAQKIEDAIQDDMSMPSD